MAYTACRFWIEGMHIDPAEQAMGLRLNQWTAAVVFLAAAIHLAATPALDKPVDAADPIGKTAINPAFPARPGPGSRPTTRRMLRRGRPSGSPTATQIRTTLRGLW